MSLFIFSSMTASILSLATFGAAWFLSTRSSSDREKTSPFECGFDPKNNARIPFSMRFFLLSIIFIVFDIEIVLLMPLPMLHLLMPEIMAFAAAFLFLLILLIGLLHEWHEGALNWST